MIRTTVTLDVSDSGFELCGESRTGKMVEVVGLRKMNSNIVYLLQRINRKIVREEEKDDGVMKGDYIQ